MIPVGKTAPDFVLKDSENTDYSLSDLRGNYVLLLFYPYDHGFFCTRQFCEYRDDWGKFTERGIRVLGINSGSSESHKNFKETHSLPFPLLSDGDFSVSKQYGAMYASAGISMRAYVFIAQSGKLCMIARAMVNCTQ